MPIKYEWRKKEKSLYLPTTQPELIELPTHKFITLRGEGSPADAAFTQTIGTLYSLAYGLKMLPKKMKIKPIGYFDYTVYPLEGVWDINEQAKNNFNGELNKQDFVYELMIRQPGFVNAEFYAEIFDLVKKKKPNPMLEHVEFKSVSEGKCVQIMHLGPYELEPESFAKMAEFVEQQGLTRVSKVHREIYLSDVRKVAPEKLKTVLRFKVQGKS